MSAPALFLGVDGGGSKTEFICIDAAGRMLARAETAGSYHLQVGFDAVVARLAEGVDTACQLLGIERGGFAQAFFGLPAFGEDKAVDVRLDAAVRALMGGTPTRCGNDMVCGWAGSLACQDGINIVAGTGSIGYGERRGRSARAGGWGEVFGDEGSAYWIAIAALRAVSRMSDGRLPRGPLHGIVADALGLEDDLDLCARVMGEDGLPRDGIAALAGLVPIAADAGDPAALAILDEAAAELFALAEAIRAALRFAADEPVPISWSGGVLANAEHVREGLRRRLAARPGYRLVEPQHGPGYGAALYAAHLAGIGRAAPA